MTKCPGLQTARRRRQRRASSCALPPAASMAGKCRFLIARPPGNKWDCLDLFLVVGRRSVVVTLPIICCISHLSSPEPISYRPSSPAAQSLIRSWGSQTARLRSGADDPLPCIDNPASPLHTRTLAHALQPPLALASCSLPSTTAAEKKKKNSRSRTRPCVFLSPSESVPLPVCV